MQVQALTHKDLAGQTATAVRPYGARLSDGEVYFAMRDYTNAALLLYGLTQPSDANRPEYNKVVAYLAESFYQLQSDLLAHRYFHELFQRNATSHMANAARRLIRIGERRATLGRIG